MPTYILKRCPVCRQDKRIQKYQVCCSKACARRKRAQEEARA